MGRVTSYDATSRQISTSNPAIQSSPLLQGSYKPDGHPASLTEANSHTISFAYDGLDRLATAWQGSAWRERRRDGRLPGRPEQESRN